MFTTQGQHEGCVLLAFGRMLAEMLLNILPCKGQPPIVKKYLAQVPAMLRLGNHGLSYGWWNINRNNEWYFWDVSLN